MPPRKRDTPFGKSARRLLKAGSSMNKINLGPRLKSLRSQKGLTMRELARMAGCSASFISQLELNRVSPSLANLEKICHALKMSVLDVLREETHLQEPIQVPLHGADQPLAMRWHRAWMRHLLPAPRAETLHRAPSSPSTSTARRPPVPRSARSTNWAIVLVGNVELIVGGKTFTLEQVHRDLLRSRDAAPVAQYRHRRRRGAHGPSLRLPAFRAGGGGPHLVPGARTACVFSAETIPPPTRPRRIPPETPPPLRAAASPAAGRDETGRASSSTRRRPGVPAR